MIEKFKTSPHLRRASEIMGTGTNKLRERLVKIDQKKKELQEKMSMPPFVRTIDKLYVGSCSLGGVVLFFAHKQGCVIM
jgi:hypothetical protein